MINIRKQVAIFIVTPIMLIGALFLAMQNLSVTSDVPSVDEKVETVVNLKEELMASDWLLELELKTSEVTYDSITNVFYANDGENKGFTKDTIRLYALTDGWVLDFDTQIKYEDINFEEINTYTKEIANEKINLSITELDYETSKPKKNGELIEVKVWR